jgi:CRISPR-associated protein Csb1
MPLLVVDFSEHGPTGDIDAVGKVTSLQVPHRLADAILRDSDLDGVAFRKSDRGRARNTLGAVSDGARLRPVGLDWSQGGLGLKFERAMVSEIGAMREAHPAPAHGVAAAR